MIKETTFDQLEQDYLAHMNGWEPPRRIQFFCFRCQTQHKGVVARRYGLDRTYRKYKDGTLRPVEYRIGMYLCMRGGLEEDVPELNLAGPSDTMTPL